MRAVSQLHSCDRLDLGWDFLERVGMWQVAGSQRQSSKADLWVVNADHCLRTRSICQLLRILVTDLTFESVHTCSSSHNAQRQIYESGTFLEKSLNPNDFFFGLVCIKLEPKYRSFVQKLYISYPWDCESRWRRWGPEYQMPSLKSRGEQGNSKLRLCLFSKTITAQKDVSHNICILLQETKRSLMDSIWYVLPFDTLFRLIRSSIGYVLPRPGR